MIALALSLALAAGPSSPLPPDALPSPEPPDPGGPIPGPPSVYRVGRADLAVTGLAIAGAILPNQFPTQLIRTRCPCSAGGVNAFDRIAIGMDSRSAGVVSDWTVALSVSVPAIADAVRLGPSAALRDDLVVFTETVALNSALVTGVKYLVQRPLPLTYAGRDGLPRQAQGYRSFYSGHTSTAVSALTAAAWTLQLRDGPQAWPWIVTGLAGASVATERVLAGRHFPTDVLVGAAAGFAVGTLVPLAHARGSPFRAAPVSIVPATSGRGLAIAGRF
jgi:membrane-associated phospholipid phosphatase